MPKSLKTSPASRTEVHWKYIRNLFFGQKVLDELRILMRLSGRPEPAHAGKIRRPTCCD